MKHFANPSFWEAYNTLPQSVQNTADKNYELLKENPKPPSLHFKKVGVYWSVRFGSRYRALAVESDGYLVWFWVFSVAWFFYSLVRPNKCG